jgi:hypothetical protein
MSSMIVIPRCDHCRHAVVLDATRVRVDALVQLRRRTQRECPEKSRADTNRNKRASMVCGTRERAHCCDLVTAPRITQEISASATATKPNGGLS